MEYPFFSVVICTYNRAKYLRQTLESVAEQKYPAEKFEVLVIDNNSLDNTEEIVFTFRSQHEHLNIRYIKESRQGISYARNRGVLEAKGEFITFLDDDETIKPGFLANLDFFFEKNREASLCSEPVIPVYGADKPDWLSPYTMRLITGAYDKGPKIKIVSANDYPGTGHATFRKSLFTKYGGFNTELGRKGSSLLGAEDKDFFLRLIQNGIKCYYVPTAAIYHHIPASKLTSDFFNRITYAIGMSERIRTLSESRSSYNKRLLSEGFKWVASIVLFLYYLIIFQYSKGEKLIQFRYNVTRGLLKGNA